MVRILGYSEEYREQTLAYLTTSHPYLCHKSYDEVIAWLNTRVRYNWTNDVSITDFPFKYGVLIMDNDTVVGYLGLIYSYINSNELPKVYVNFRSWSIDKKYGFYLYPAMTQIIETADIIGEFTPSSTIREICVKMYHFKPLDSSILKFYPTPTKLKCISYQEIYNPDKITNPKTRNEYVDHLRYGIKCLEITFNDGMLYILFKRERARAKKILPAHLATILQLSNIDLFHKHYKESIWILQKSGNYFVNVEGRFLDDFIISNARNYRLYNNNKLAYFKSIPDNPLGLLYSEIIVR